MTIYIDMSADICEGCEFFTVSDTLRLGQTVEVARFSFVNGRYHGGRPIGLARCIGIGTDEEISNRDENTKHAWSKYRKIKIERIY